MGLHSWHSPKTEVRSNSMIEGSGLFAKDKIYRNEVVAVKGGHVADRPTLNKAGDLVNGVSLKITSELYIAPLTKEERESTMTYFNHSCDANVGIAGNIVTVAMRDIEPGEELTIDYAMFEDNPDYSMQCNCSSIVCRGLLTGNDWRNPEIRKKYNGYFSWYIQHRVNDSSPMPESSLR